jgi:hypothetical protein
VGESAFKFFFTSLFSADKFGIALAFFGALEKIVKIDS